MGARVRNGGRKREMEERARHERSGEPSAISRKRLAGEGHEQQVSLSRLEMFHGDLDALPLLRVMITDEFKGAIGLISSFGADAALLLSLVAEVDPATPVLFLETHKHFPETLDYARTLTEKLGLTQVHWLTPDPELVSRIDPKGDLWSTQPNRCCWMRKVEPLDRAVAQLGLKALITGRKRYQTPERANMADH